MKEETKLFRVTPKFRRLLYSVKAEIPEKTLYDIQNDVTEFFENNFGRFIGEIKSKTPVKDRKQGFWMR
jgi:hypothetical protein